MWDVCIWREAPVFSGKSGSRRDLIFSGAGCKDFTLFPACAASRELASKLFRLPKNPHRTYFIDLLSFFSFISLNNVWLLLDLQNVQISAVCAFAPLYSQLSSPPYLFIYLRSQQLPLIFLQKLNTPVACVIISASLWQRVCTPRFFSFFLSFCLFFFFFYIFSLMLLQLLIMWR